MYDQRLSNREKHRQLEGVSAPPAINIRAHRNKGNMPFERLWGVMHRNVTHNKTYATCAQFADATLEFLREKVPRNWVSLCDSVSDNFRVISPKDFRVVA